MSKSVTTEEPEWLEKDLWEDMFEGLVDFKNKHGHLNIPDDYQYHDEYLVYWLEQQRKQERLRSKTRRLSQDKIERLQSIGVDFELPQTEATRPVPVKAEKVSSEEKGEFEEEWEHMYKGLKVFKKTLGHLDVPKGCEYFGESLYEWVKTQRERFKDTRKRHVWRGKIDRLQSLGLNLNHTDRRRKREDSSSSDEDTDDENDVSDDESVWSIMFDGLVEFKMDNGHLNVQPGCQYRGNCLHRWLRVQKTLYGNVVHGKKPDMTPARFDRLSMIGFNTIMSNSPKGKMTAEEWDRMFEALVEYKSNHGDINIPSGYIVHGRDLRSWLDNQRRLYSNPSTRRGQHRLEKFRSLGVPNCSMRLQDAKWQAMFDALADFKRIHGHLNIPSSLAVDGKSLATWMAAQRRAYKNRLEHKRPALRDYRLRCLESIGFDFSWHARRVMTIDNGIDDGLDSSRESGAVPKAQVIALD